MKFGVWLKSESNALSIFSKPNLNFHLAHHMQTWGKQAVKSADFFFVREMRKTEANTHRSLTMAVRTSGPGFYRIDKEINRALAEIEARQGLLNVFAAHTSASLCVQENADPDVLSDLQDALSRLAPEHAGYRHNSEGPDDMPAHIKTLLTATSLALPVREGRLALGTWQAVYLIEHRAAGHHRRVELDFIGVVYG
jgi:secondary thiamine-phosphate synthase enzyme